jgi:hypothetical protein
MNDQILDMQVNSLKSLLFSSGRGQTVTHPKMDNAPCNLGRSVCKVTKRGHPHLVVTQSWNGCRLLNMLVNLFHDRFISCSD